MTRHLATVKTIDRISPIEGADRIVAAHIGGWPVVVTKNDYHEGDRVVYFEPDSMLPLDNPLFAPLESRGRHAVNSRGDSCVVLRTVRLRGQVSQGLAMSFGELGINGDTPLGTDVSSVLNVEKYDPPEVVSGNMIMRRMPSFITVTDEERVQNLPDMVEWLAHHPVIARGYRASEKLDGTSTSYYAVYNEDNVLTGHGACSRNNEVIEPEDHAGNIYWLCWDRYGIMDRLDAIKNAITGDSDDSDANSAAGAITGRVRRDGRLVITVQGETTGPGINGNRLERKTVEFHAFNVLVNGERLDPAGSALNLDHILGDITVPQLSVSLVSGDDAVLGMDEIIGLSDGRKSVVTPSRLAEGIVWRYDEPIVDGMAPEWRHFKAINNSYLVKLKN